MLPHRWQASSPSEEWPPPLVSRGRIGFACAGLTPSLSRLVGRSPGAAPQTDPFRAVSYPSTPDRSYMLNEQFTWLTPRSQRERSGLLPGVTEAHEGCIRDPRSSRRLFSLLCGETREGRFAGMRRRNPQRRAAFTTIPIFLFVPSWPSRLRDRWFRHGRCSPPTGLEATKGASLTHDAHEAVPCILRGAVHCRRGSKPRRVHP